MSDYRNKEAELAESLQRAIRNVMRNSLIVDGIIINTDNAETQYTCDVQLTASDGQPVFTSVPLRVLVGSGASFVEIPELNSECLMCFRDGNSGRPQILMIDKVLKILVNCNEVIFNGGDLGGMVKVIELTAKLNKVESDLNTIKGAFETWVPVAGDGGAALKTAATIWAGETITLTERADIEDTTITH